MTDATSEPPLDLVLCGGTVVDGGSGPPRVADVAVRGDRIVHVGPDARRYAAAATEVVDVSGRLVLPGFVDAHSHADGRLGDPAVTEAYLRQGVTTVVVGQDGVSFAPSCAATAGELDRYFSAVNGPRPGALSTDASTAGLLAHFDTGIGVNAAALVPAGNIRAQIAGFAPHTPTADELRRMRALVARGLADGAVGLSTGLEYVPGGFADAAELAELCRPVAEAGAVHVSHMRGYEEHAHTGIEELRRIAARSGVATHVSHFHGPAAALRPLLDSALDAGLDFSFDSYPYTRGSTILSMLTLPPELQTGRSGGTLALLKDPATRRELGRTWFPTLGDLPERVILAYTAAPSWRWAEGRRLTEVAATVDRPVGELICDLLVDCELGVGCLVQQPAANTDDDVSELAQHRVHMAGSDGIFMGGAPHPRAYGAFARFLRDQVLERANWSWADAVQHLSTRAVARFGLGDRGLIATGKIADLVVLDAGRVADLATYDDSLQFADGVDHVVIGGAFALRDGHLRNATAGRAIRRGGSS
ncbi:N-acyl-D-amino-acid deacylase family protein [Streptomyces sp. NPDC001312]|uniref:N-acyl-D-amino-acid deacylase family protein n=1 Tax=Streptomyces sp. NPDC001312 TaxID=3364561 RepID=UPI00367B5859